MGFLLLAGLAACGGDADDATPDDGGSPDRYDVPDEAGDSEVETTPDGEEDDGGGTFLPYLYVMISDRDDDTAPSVTHTAGVDVDGIELIQDGASFFADQVYEVTFGDGDNAFATDGNQVLGAPDATCSTTAGETPTYVSLGGSGGWLVVGFGGVELREGDQILVHECGAEDEPYDVFVGVATAASDPNWIVVASNASGTTTADLPALPSVPAP